MLSKDFPVYNLCSIFIMILSIAKEKFHNEFPLNEPEKITVRFVPGRMQKWRRDSRFLCTEKDTSHSYMELKLGEFTQPRVFSWSAWKILPIVLLYLTQEKPKCFCSPTACASWWTSCRIRILAVCGLWRLSFQITFKELHPSTLTGTEHAVLTTFLYLVTIG